MLDYFEDDFNFYIIMEKPEQCVDLYDFIVDNVTLAESVARGIFTQLLEAVEYCFSKDLVHRDIKSENVLLDLKNKEVKLIDFGCSRFLHERLHGIREGMNRWLQ